jgi:hypothetical protein
MKEYWSIPTFEDKFLGVDCMAFAKYDGNNIRAEWSRKSGWYKFGSRHRLIDQYSEFYPAVDVFKNTLAEGLEKVFRDNGLYKCDQAIVFMEYLGPHSFAGNHDVDSLNYLGFDVEHNDPKEVILIDVNIHKKGIVSPKDFVKDFGHLKSAEVIYEGELSEEFVEDVQEGKYSVREGVVCKWGHSHSLGMTKIKTFSYLEELKKRFGNDWNKYV